MSCPNSNNFLPLKAALEITRISHSHVNWKFFHNFTNQYFEKLHILASLLAINFDLKGVSRHEAPEQEAQKMNQMNLVQLNYLSFLQRH